MAVWPPRETLLLLDKLIELRELVESPPDSQEDEVTAWLARLLVVRSCGYLEQTAAAVCQAYVRERSGGLPRAFALSWMQRSQNPGPEALETFVGRFDSTLAAELTEQLDADDQRLRRELGFLVDRRNKIAHGLSEGVGRRKALDLEKVAREVADWFVLRFNPDR